MAESELTVAFEGDPLNPESANVDGNFYESDGSIHLQMTNLGSDDVIIKWLGTRVVDHPDRPIIDREFTVPNGFQYILKATSPLYFNDSLGKVHVTYTSTGNPTLSGVTVAAIQIREETP